MPDFATLYQTACDRKGGETALQALLPKVLTAATLRKKPEAEYLAEFSKKVFQSGFVWRVVENKWPAFEQLFWDFDPDKLVLMPDDMLEQRASDPRIIRNLRKVAAIRANALMIVETRRQQGHSFSRFVADWPGDNIVGLWDYLKQHGTRLGGNTGPYALRTLGKDTFLLTQDVEAYLRGHKIISGGLGSKSSLVAIQHYFNELAAESGWSLAALSRLIAFNSGANTVV